MFENKSFGKYMPVNRWPFVFMVLAVVVVFLRLGWEGVMFFLIFTFGFEVMFRLPLLRYLRQYFERNVVGYSILLYTSGGRLKHLVIANNGEVPLVECDDIAFTLPLSGWIAPLYTLERKGEGWRDLPWGIDRRDDDFKTINPLVVVIDERGKRPRILADGITARDAINLIRRQALDELRETGVILDVYA
jgi:hypothetical protein